MAQRKHNKNLGSENVTGCILEGAVSVPFKTNLTGKDLGPLSADSERLAIGCSNKAVLVLKKIDFAKTHDLIELLSILTEKEPLLASRNPV